MIRSFKDRAAKPFFEGAKSARPWSSIAAVASRKLDYLDAATKLASLNVPPGNRLEALAGDRKGQHSIRISDQWRICFRWTPEGAEDVEIVDYH